MKIKWKAVLVICAVALVSTACRSEEADNINNSNSKDYYEMVSDETYDELLSAVEIVQIKYEHINNTKDKADISADTGLADYMDDANYLLEELTSISKDNLTEANSKCLIDSLNYLSDGLESYS